MITKKQFFFLGSVRDSLIYILNQMNLRYNIKVSEIHKIENCLYFEIFIDCFNIDFYNYLYDQSDFMEVFVSKDGAIYKVKFNLA